MFFSNFVARSRGAAANAKAEIIPVEPDQDNACAGKVRVSLPLLSCFCKTFAQ